jgi:hypothetical protein
VITKELKVPLFSSPFASVHSTAVRDGKGLVKSYLLGSLQLDFGDESGALLYREIVPFLDSYVKTNMGYLREICRFVMGTKDARLRRRPLQKHDY